METVKEWPPKARREQDEQNKEIVKKLIPPTALSQFQPKGGSKLGRGSD